MEYVPIFAKKGSDIVAWAVVDEEDYLRLSRHRWLLTVDGMPVRARGNSYVQMGHDVMRTEGKKNIRIEHLDGNPLNNQKINLSIGRAD